jgi:lipoprotein signal peptidase
MTQKIFIWTSPLPLLMFWGVSIYLNQFEGWGQWAGGILLLGPVVLSLLMAVMGIVLIVFTKKKQEPVANLWFSTLMAGSLGLYVLIKGIVQELTKSFG